MDQDKKYLQLPRFQTHQRKSVAIALVENHINDAENIDKFFDGEEIAIEYKGSNGEQMYTTAVVKKTNGVAKLYVSIEESETLKIVASDAEPVDKKVLWITEDTDPDDGESTENLKEEVQTLKATIKKLEETVNRHDYALSSTIAGGDIILNSEKYALENENTPEIPPDGIDYTDYATEDLVIDSFEVYIANSPLSRFSGAEASLYLNQNYFLKLRLYNVGKELIPNDGSVTLSIQHGSEVKYEEEKQILVGLKSGTTTVVAVINGKDGFSMEKPYLLDFQYNEKPGYETYAEPNVKHLILKSVKNKQILLDNVNYLCVNEPIWCISECALYIKGEMADGRVALFKISGGGGGEDPIIPDTGSTSGDTTSVTIDTTFVVDENGTLSITTSDENGIYVDENGFLVINVGGSVTDEGILYLEDHKSEGGGGGGGDGGDTPGDSSGASVDEDGELIITGETNVDENGILLLNATVTSDGILQITA